MALGRAFVEVHADLKPFKRDLGKQVNQILRDTEKQITQSITRQMDQMSRTIKKSMGGKNATVKLDADLSGVRARLRALLDRVYTVKVSLDADKDKDTDFVKKTGNKLRNALTGAAEGAFKALKNSQLIRNALIATLIAGAIAASPLIAGIISSALIAGVGLAGIGAGIALAFRDARIQSAAQDLGQRVLESLTKAAGVFVEPVMRAMKTIESAFNDILPDLTLGFQRIAPYIDSLAIGLGGFIRQLGSALDSVLGNSGPLIQSLAFYLPKIGDALGYMLETLSESEGAQAAFVGFLQIIVELIYTVTDILAFASDVFEGFVRIVNEMPDFLIPDQYAKDIDEMIAAMDRAKEPAATTTTGIRAIGSAASGSSQQVNALKTSLDVFFGDQLTRTEANLRFQESIDNITASFKENGRTLNTGTEAGRANIRTVNEGIKAAIQYRDATLKQTGSLALANQKYNEQIGQLRGVLRQAGLTEKQIDQLIGAYDEIPPEVSTQVDAPGLQTALNNARALNAALNKLAGSAYSAGDKNDDPRFGKYAEGGIVRRQQMAMVGEGNRAEAIIPLTKPRRAMEVMSQAGLLGVGGGTIVVQMVLDGQVIDERIVRHDMNTARQLQGSPRGMI